MIPLNYIVRFSYLFLLSIHLMHGTASIKINTLSTNPTTLRDTTIQHDLTILHVRRDTKNIYIVAIDETDLFNLYLFTFSATTGIKISITKKSFAYPIILATVHAPLIQFSDNNYYITYIATVLRYPASGGLVTFKADKNFIIDETYEGQVI